MKTLNTNRPTRGRVAIIVDTPDRDLRSATWLAKELADRSFDVFLVPYNLRREELLAIAPDITVLNFLRNRNVDLVSELYAMGMIMTIVEVEGLNMAHLKSALPSKKSAQDMIEVLFCWGDRARDEIVKLGIFQNTTLEVSGSPRFDWYVDPLRRGFESPSGLKDINGPLILMPTSFALYNHMTNFVNDSDCILRDMVKNYGRDEEALKKSIALQIEGLPKFMKEALNLAEAFPEAQVLVRPHPREYPGAYEDWHDSAPNLSISTDDSIEAILSRTTAMVTISSATEVDCVLSGIPCLTMGWVPYEPIRAWTGDISDIVESWEMMIERLKEILNGGGIGQELASRQKKFKEYWFHGRDSRNASRVAVKLDEIFSKKANTVDRVQCREKLYQRPFKSRRHARSVRAARIASFLRLPVQWVWKKFQVFDEAIYWDTSDKEYDVARVRNIFKDMERAGEARDVAASYEISLAREAKAYIAPYHGRSIRVRPLNS